jgi:excinuclease ABC subunit A
MEKGTAQERPYRGLPIEPREIQIQGAREHNLKGVDVSIPRERFVVITGPSGSGKSSLAKDTLYAEGHRRYVECLSAEARQYLQQVRKPAVDQIDALPPAIYIEQRPSGRSPRSTVGTATELYDLLRLLYAKIGVPHCHRCGEPVQAQSLEQMADRILELPDGTRLILLAPLLGTPKGGWRKVVDNLERQGFLRIRVDGGIHELSDPKLRKRGPVSTSEVVVDRLAIRPGIRGRLTDSIEMASRLSEGMVRAWIDPETAREQEWTFSEQPVCGSCGASFPEVTPRLFSFNSPHGACPDCSGLGKLRRVDAHLVVPDTGLSLDEGAILPWQRRPGVHVRQVFESLADHLGFDLYTPFGKIPARARKALLHGSEGRKIPFHFRGASESREILQVFEGVIPNLERRYRETNSEKTRQEIGAYMTVQDCPACKGARLKPEALSVTLGGRGIGDLTSRSMEELRRFFDELELSAFQQALVGHGLEQLRLRLAFLCELGLDYLTLDREGTTLSGGEAQRIQLATHIGSGLVGVLYILDEPTLGLHPRDTRRLLGLVKTLRDRGNTVVVVEHDAQTILEADHVIDMGPGAGVAGGEIVFRGTPGELLGCPDSLTGQYMSGIRSVPVAAARRRPDRGTLVIKGARQNNLKGVTARIPLGLLTCVTGVSGSGKSSLVLDALYPSLADRLSGPRDPRLDRPRRDRKASRLEGTEFLDRVIPVDQTPLSRSPRSNPATYTGLLSLVRDLFAQLPEARRRGYGPTRFSFNVKGGRCEVCQGDGLRKVEMHFLPDVFVTCDLCKGRRYNRETLEIRYRGKNMADVLAMTVEEALAFFDAVPQLQRRLEILSEVGLGYIQLGQPATTLSGGEAQRVKLARELGKATTGRTLYLMDEPTTGLHFVDIERLLEVLRRLTEAGNTVLVIEHNLDVIRAADWVIDMGPEAGEKGGRIVVEGPPERVASAPDSHTGRYLREVMEADSGIR